MSSSQQPMLMPYEGQDVPHLLIEVNQKCDISCRACYKDKFGYTKPLRLIKQEIDQAVQERNLHMLTLAGGEPSLHPELPEVIRYAASKGVQVQMLSNGYQLSDEKLAAYKEAGLAKVYLHIDSMQRRPDATPGSTELELNALRERLGAKVRKHGLNCAVSLTLYRDNLDELDEVVKFVLNSPSVQRLLVTCCTDFSAIARKYAEAKSAPRETKNNTQPGDLDGQEVANAEVEAQLKERLDMVPYGYVGSSHSTEERRWIFYYSFAITRGEQVDYLHMPVTFKRIVRFFNHLGKKYKGRYPFGRVLNARRSVLVAMVNAAISGSPRVILKTAAFLAKLLRPGAQIHQKSLVFQQGPNVTADGELEYCRNCPDATIRNGKLVPVCMADFVSPTEEELEPVGAGVGAVSDRRASRRGRTLPRAGTITV